MFELLDPVCFVACFIVARCTLNFLGRSSLLKFLDLVGWYICFITVEVMAGLVLSSETVRLARRFAPIIIYGSDIEKKGTYMDLVQLRL